MSNENEPLSKEEYEMTQELLLNLARQARLLPLDRFLMAIERADSIGPIVDPTLWMRGHKNIDVIKKMAKGALEFQNSLPKACARCKVREVAYEGAVYCGAACSAQAEAHQ